MKKVIPIITLISLVLPCSGIQQINAQSITIYYGDNKTIQDCSIISVTEFSVSVEYSSWFPLIHSSKNLSLTSITGIREYSRANKYAPYLAIMGSYIGVKYFQKEPQPWSEKSWSERFATWLDEPVTFISSICVGGAVGYLAGHYLLGGNRELIMLDKLSSAEKQTLLTAYIEPSKCL